MAFGGVVLQLIDKCVLFVKYVFFLQRKSRKTIVKSMQYFIYLLCLFCESNLWWCLQYLKGKVVLHNKNVWLVTEYISINLHAYARTQGANLCATTNLLTSVQQ